MSTNHPPTETPSDPARTTAKATIVRGNRLTEFDKLEDDITAIIQTAIDATTAALRREVEGLRAEVEGYRDAIFHCMLLTHEESYSFDGSNANAFLTSGANRLRIERDDFRKQRDTALSRAEALRTVLEMLEYAEDGTVSTWPTKQARDEAIRGISPHSEEDKETLCLVSQLLEGWHSDGTAWSKHDEDVHQRVIEMQKRQYAAIDAATKGEA